MTLPCNHLEYTLTAVHIIPAATSTSSFPGTSLVTTELGHPMSIIADAVPVHFCNPYHRYAQPGRQVDGNTVLINYFELAYYRIVYFKLVNFRAM